MSWSGWAMDVWDPEIRPISFPQEVTVKRGRQVIRTPVTQDRINHIVLIIVTPTSLSWPLVPTKCLLCDSALHVSPHLIATAMYEVVPIINSPLQMRKTRLRRVG